MRKAGLCIAGCSEKEAERKDYPILHLKLQNEIINDISGCNKGCKSHNLLIYTLVCGERDSVYAECLSLLEQRGYIHNDIKVHNDIQVDNN